MRWLLGITGATVIAAIPTRLSSHHAAFGIPFTWHSRQEIITLGEQPHSFSPWLLLLDIGIVLAAFILLRVAISRLLCKPKADEKVTTV